MYWTEQLIIGNALSRYNGRAERKESTMKTEYVLEKLVDAGIQAEEINVVKNDVVCHGLRICNENSKICPVIYYDQDEDPNDVIRRVKQVMSLELPVFDLDLIQTSEYIYGHVYLSVDRRAKEDQLRKRYLDFDLIVKLYVNEESDVGCIRINRQFIDTTGVEEDKIWDYALRNTRKKLCIQTMQQALGIPEEIDISFPFYICGTTDKYDGAAILAYPEMFQDLLEGSGSDITYIIPSSTQEALALPVVGESMPVTDLVQMVREVNHTCVDPTLWMPESIYVYRKDAEEIEIAATLAGKRAY